MAGQKGVVEVASQLWKTATRHSSLLQAAVPYSTAGGVSLYKLPELPYGYSALGEEHHSTSTAICHTHTISIVILRLLPHQHYHCPDLALCWDPAEPVISGQIMEIHHSKHHATYVTNLNKALEQYAEAEAKHDLQKMISLQSAINFNGGGALPVTHSTW